jgi:hypothetical protein
VQGRTSMRSTAHTPSCFMQPTTASAPTKR